LILNILSADIVEHDYIDVEWPIIGQFDDGIRSPNTGVGTFF
jgi:hypothetical protein